MSLHLVSYDEVLILMTVSPTVLQPPPILIYASKPTSAGTPGAPINSAPSCCWALSYLFINEPITIVKLARLYNGLKKIIRIINKPKSNQYADAYLPYFRK
jgi:hypothetical protein